MERTLVIVKHDGVARGLVGEIIFRIERVGFKLIAFEMVRAEEDMASNHYPNSDEWKRKVGERTLEEYVEKGLDPMEELGTKDVIEIGEKVKKWNVDFLTAGPVVAMVWEGPNVVSVIRKLVGHTVPALALPGTIRGDFSWDSAELSNAHKRPFYNLIHASGTPEEAQEEIALWFDKLEVLDYGVSQHKVMGLKGRIDK